MVEKTKKEVENFLEKLTNLTNSQGIILENGKVHFRKPENKKDVYLRPVGYNHALKKYEICDYE